MNSTQIKHVVRHIWLNYIGNNIEQLKLSCDTLDQLIAVGKNDIIEHYNTRHRRRGHCLNCRKEEPSDVPGILDIELRNININRDTKIVTVVLYVRNTKLTVSHHYNFNRK